jgi:hypothetical protein
LCRRRWDICDAEFLRYKTLNAFDRAMIHLEKVRKGLQGCLVGSRNCTCVPLCQWDSFFITVLNDAAGIWLPHCWPPIREPEG